MLKKGSWFSYCHESVENEEEFGNELAAPPILGSQGSGLHRPMTASIRRKVNRKPPIALPSIAIAISVTEDLTRQGLK